jgi:hypothetical protein
MKLTLMAFSASSALLRVSFTAFSLEATSINPQSSKQDASIMDVDRIATGPYFIEDVVNAYMITGVAGASDGLEHLSSV